MKIKIFTIIAIFTVVGFCQDYIKENYNVNDGLISSSVSTIYQDRNGFIWIGSNEGISRFDGQEFVNYKRPEFFNSGIKKFLQINKDELIILNNDGSIFRFDGMSFVKDSSFNSIIDIDYYNNKLFTIDNNGLTIEGEEKKYYSLKLKKFQQNKDQLYLIGYNSIFVWNEGKPKPLFKNEPYQFSSIIKHSTGNFWVGTKNNGVLKYENEKWIKLSYYPGVEIFDIKEEKSTAVWVSKNIGLERIIQNSLGDIYNFSEILTINSSSVYIDKKNNIWCGSSGNGLYKYHKNLFNNFTANSGFSAIFGTVLLMDSKNRLWTQAYGNGLIMFDNKINYFNESTGFPGKIALSCVEDREGNVLIAADGQIYKYMNDQFILQDRKNLPEERIRILLNDGQNIWASLSIQGVWKHEDNEWLKFPLPTDYKEYSIISMFQDSKNGLWFGGWRSGLFYYNGDSVVSFLGDSLFMETKIYSIIEDNSNNIWVGTENGAFVIDGLNVIDTINSEKGLRSNKVYALGKYEDKILLGTAEGFSIYDDGLISTFTTENGLSSNDISSDKILIDEVGKVWMGNTAGVSMFNIQNYLEQERTYKILLTSVETSTDTLNYSVFADDMIILPEFSTNLDFVKFNFSSIDFSKDATEYKYCLKSDNDSLWIPFIDFTITIDDVKHGEYDSQIEVRTFNQDWKLVYSVPVTFRKPFYVSASFWTMVFTILGIIASIISYRKKKQKRANKYKTSSLSKKITKELSCQILDLIKKDNLHLDPQLTLQILAENLKIPKEHVSQIINTEFDTNFNNFINSYRIDHAKKLLETDTTSMTIMQIAYSSGFNSKSSFNYAFKKFTDMTPTEYKKSIATDFTDKN